MFYKRAVLKNFAIFTGKRLCLSLFLKVLGMHFYGKRLQPKCFPLDIGKILRTPILKNISTAASVDCRNFYRATESQIEIKFE